MRSRCHTSLSRVVLFSCFFPPWVLLSCSSSFLLFRFFSNSQILLFSKPMFDSKEFDCHLLSETLLEQNFRTESKVLSLVPSQRMCSCHLLAHCHMQLTENVRFIDGVSMWGRTLYALLQGDHSRKIVLSSEKSKAERCQWTAEASMRCVPTRCHSISRDLPASYHLILTTHQRQCY